VSGCCNALAPDARRVTKNAGSVPHDGSGNRWRPAQLPHCIWSSIVDSALLTLSPFFTSSAVTYGYSPYSRKLGFW
jgi:hypothetical protein